jgi:hypothetical protein
MSQDSRMKSALRGRWDSASSKERDAWQPVPSLAVPQSRGTPGPTPRLDPLMSHTIPAPPVCETGDSQTG